MADARPGAGRSRLAQRLGERGRWYASQMETTTLRWARAEPPGPFPDDQAFAGESDHLFYEVTEIEVED